MVDKIGFAYLFGVALAMNFSIVTSPNATELVLKIVSFGCAAAIGFMIQKSR